MEIPTFDMKVFGKLIDANKENGNRELTFESSVDSRVRGSLKIATRSLPDASVELREAWLSFHATEQTPQPLFIVDTLYAMLGLGGRIGIFDPDANQHVLLSFTVQLSELSELLQRRQTYFALMVIEKASGRSFEIPEYISGDEMSSIFFASRAIVERQFVWRVNNITLPVPANTEMLAWFRNLKPSTPNAPRYKMQFGPTPVRKVIFGQEILLGDETVFIEDGIIENRDEIETALARMDGRVYPIRIEPESRIGRYLFSNSPSLPAQSWDDKIQRFIELNSALSQHLTARYLARMSILMPELPPEQAYALINPETIAKLAEEAREHRIPVDRYLNELLNRERTALSRAETNDNRFEADMAAFAEGTEHLKSYSGRYSRSDIYLDHD
jgi:hypothetical protein